MSRRYRLFAIFAAITLLLDQASKAWARSELGPLGPAGRAFIGDWFHLRLSYNFGTAFSIVRDLGAARLIVIAVGLITCGVMLWLLHRARDQQGRLAMGLGLFFGGALGNIIDRALAGKVTDFIIWRYGTWEWPAFNIADAALVLAVVFLLLDRGGEPRPSPSSAPT